MVCEWPWESPRGKGLLLLAPVYCPCASVVSPGLNNIVIPTSLCGWIEDEDLRARSRGLRNCRSCRAPNGLLGRGPARRTRCGCQEMNITETLVAAQNPGEL
jgi:hypothetical protein